MPETNYGRQGRIGVDQPAVIVVFYLLGFSLKQKNDCSPPGADIQRLIGSIKNQYFRQLFTLISDDSRCFIITIFGVDCLEIGYRRGLW